jgi:branched-chain amino acid transport system ATP-binding protein
VQMALLSRERMLNSFLGDVEHLLAGEAGSLLERVAMGDQAQRPCSVLAYGDLKRVELAMALAHRPRLLLMDEPTAGMAPEERQALMQLAAGLARSEKMAVLYTEHDMDAVFGFADRVIVLHGGEVVSCVPPQAIKQDPRVREVYLGDA